MVSCSRSPTTGPLGSEMGTSDMLQILISFLLGLSMATCVRQFSATSPWRFGVKVQKGTDGAWIGTHFSWPDGIVHLAASVVENNSDLVSEDSSSGMGARQMFGRWISMGLAGAGVKRGNWCWQQGANWMGGGLMSTGEEIIGAVWCTAQMGWWPFFGYNSVLSSFLFSFFS